MTWGMTVFLTFAHTGAKLKKTEIKVCILAVNLDTSRCSFSDTNQNTFQKHPLFLIHAA